MGRVGEQTAPLVATDYVHASKAVMFADGTVMTTAANLSGGVKEIGDLNLVSASGSVVASAGGKPVLIIEPQGFVAFPSADADEPRAMGVVVDGTGGRISIGGALHIDHNANTSAISTAAQALHVNASALCVVLARAGAFANDRHRHTDTVCGDCSPCRVWENERCESHTHGTASVK